MNPTTDAIQLARSVHIGNYESFWSIIRHYLNDNELDADIDELPTVHLVLELCTLIDQLHRTPPTADPRQWFATQLEATREGRADGLG